MDFYTPLIGGATAAINNIIATNARREAERRQYNYSEMAAQNADTRQRALIEDYYTPEAQLKQLEKAGLSPSVYFGGTPQTGGTGAAQGSGAQGAQAYYEPLSLTEAANVDLATAQAELTREKAKELRGENKMGDATITKLLSDAGLSKAAERAKNAEATLAELTQTHNVKYAEHLAAKAQHDADRAWWEAENANLDYQFNIETYKTRVDKVEWEHQNEFLKALLTSQQVQLTEAQIDLVNAQVKAVAEELLIKWGELHVHEKGQKAQQEWWEWDITNKIEQLKLELVKIDKHFETLHTGQIIELFKIYTSFMGTALSAATRK